MDYDWLREYCLSKPGTSEDLPFGPDTLALRVGGKIFALAGLEEVISPRVNLKCDPDRAVQLREQYPDAVLPGYHMNKKHWNTVLLRSNLPLNHLAELVDHSYELILASLPVAQRKAILAGAE